jgi:hypothetical protein
MCTHLGDANSVLMGHTATDRGRMTARREASGRKMDGGAMRKVMERARTQNGRSKGISKLVLNMKKRVKS